MTSAFIQKLSSQIRCPVCGAENKLEAGFVLRSPTGATAIYQCGAEFGADEKEITVSSPCTAGSMLAVKLMTIEAQGKAKR